MGEIIHTESACEGAIALITGKPASASRRKPIICSSVNRFFIVQFPLGGYWTPTIMWLIEGAAQQLDAYNAKDLPSWLATYAPDAEQFELHGERLAAGHGEIGARMQTRFSEPDLHAHLLSRIAMGTVVVDHERITRDFPEGKGTIEMLCLYEVREGLIRKPGSPSGKSSSMPPETEGSFPTDLLRTWPLHSERMVMFSWPSQLA